jgi:integrase
VSADLVPFVDAELVDARDPQQERDEQLSQETIDDLSRATAANTVRAYTRWWATATAWCAQEGRTVMPMTSKTLAEFVGHLTRTPSPRTGKPYSPNSIEQAISAIRVAHYEAGLEGQPHTKAALRLLKVYRQDRAKAGWTVRQAPPLVLDKLRLMLRACDATTAAGQRDAVILVLGYGMMGRRSELSAIQVQHIRIASDWVTVFIPMSKTDQAAAGETTDIPRALAPDIDAAAVVRRWLATLAEQGITTGPLIRQVHKSGTVLGGITGQSIGNRARATAKAAGLTDAAFITAHGLRAGGPTDAAERGVAPVFIARHGRWSEKSTQVLTYIRPSDKRRSNPLLPKN